MGTKHDENFGLGWLDKDRITKQPGLLVLVKNKK